MTRIVAWVVISLGLFFAVPPVVTGQEGTADQYMSLFGGYFAGEWDETITQKDGAVTTGTWSCELSPTKNCLLLYGTDNGKPTMHSVAGYDPATRAMKEFGFQGDGGNYTLIYRLPVEVLRGDAVGKVLKGHFEDVTRDGKKGSGDIVLTLVNREKWEAVFQNQTRDGQKLADLKAVFQRKKK